MRMITNYMALIILILAAACHSQPSNGDDPASEPIGDLVTFTEEQMVIAGIEAGKMKKRLVADAIGCTGFIDVPPTNRATVHAPIEGIIKTLGIIPGKQLTKNEIVATIADQEIVKLQEEYLNIHAKLEYMQIELARKQKLYDNDAISKKDYLETKNQFNLTSYKVQSLEKQLVLLNLSSETLLNNGISPFISIRSPFDGFVTNVFINMGMHVDEDVPIFEIINYDHLHLELSVYSGEISKIKPGQKVRFQFAGSEEGGWGRVQIIGKNVDDINRSILIHAHIDEADRELTVGTSILANILSNADTVFTLPESAIINQGDKSFIFTKNGNEFSRIPITTGRAFNGYVEVLDYEDIKGLDVVLAGVYYLLD